MQSLFFVFTFRIPRSFHSVHFQSFKPDMPEPHYIALMQEQKITKNDKKVSKSDRKIPDFENGLKTHVRNCIVKNGNPNRNLDRNRD